MEEQFGNIIKPIVLRTPFGLSYFDYDEIIMIKADKHNCVLYSTKRKSPYCIFHTISYMENKYCNNELIRCHRSYLVNIKHIDTLVLKNRELYLRLNIKVPLSIECLKKIMKISEMKMKDNLLD